MRCTSRLGLRFRCTRTPAATGGRFEPVQIFMEWEHSPTGWFVHGEAPTTDKERLQTTMTLPRSFNFWLKSLLDPDPACSPPASQGRPGTDESKTTSANGVDAHPENTRRGSCAQGNGAETMPGRRCGLRLHGAREFSHFRPARWPCKLWSTLQQAIQKESPYYLRSTGPRSVGKSVLSHWLIQQAHRRRDSLRRLF